MEFEYYYVKAFSDTLDIENLGNCFIEAYNDIGARYYLWIKTDFGFTKILQGGPFVGDGKIPCKNCSLQYEETSFTDAKMVKKIQAFLNNPKYEITQAFNKQDEYDEQEKLSKLYNIIEYMGEL